MSFCPPQGNKQLQSYYIEIQTNFSMQKALIQMAIQNTKSRFIGEPLEDKDIDNRKLEAYS